LLVSTAGEMTVTDLYRVRTYAEELYTGFALGDDLLTAWRTALPGIAAGISLLLLTIAVIRRLPASLRGPLRARRRFDLGRFRPVAAGGLLLGGAAVLGLPLASLIYKAGLVYRPAGDTVDRRWSAMESARNVLGSFVEYREELGWTLLISVCSATAAWLIACVLTWFARRGGWRAWPAIVAAAGGIATPAPLLGLGVIWLLNRRTPAICIWLYDDTIFAPVLALTLRIVPLAILGCWFVLQSISTDLLDNAAVCGAGFWRRLVYVVLPLRAPALLALWIVLAALAGGDLAASILTVPPGVTTVPIRVFGLMHAGVDDQVAGLSLAALVFPVAIALSARCLLRRR
jgi:iron(III) transport system permease protein